MANKKDKGTAIPAVPSGWIAKIKRGSKSRRLLWVCRDCGFVSRNRTRYCGGCGKEKI